VPGTYTLFAQAEDSFGVFGDPFVLALTVTVVPAIFATQAGAGVENPRPQLFLAATPVAMLS
jgi:hypothetical protein